MSAKAAPGCFSLGEYVPLEVQGTKAKHVVAFFRRLEEATVLVVVPRLVAGLVGEINIAPIGQEIWEDTHVLLPFSDAFAKFRNAFTGEVVDMQENGGRAKIDLSKLLAEFPVALCSIR